MTRAMLLVGTCLLLAGCGIGEVYWQSNNTPGQAAQPTPAPPPPQIIIYQVMPTPTPDREAASRSLSEDCQDEPDAELIVPELPTAPPPDACLSHAMLIAAMGMPGAQYCVPIPNAGGMIAPVLLPGNIVLIEMRQKKEQTVFSRLGYRVIVLLP